MAMHEYILPSGIKRFHFDAVDSTNTEAERRVKDNYPTPFWITSDIQLSGKGRRGRSWESKKGTLSCSYITQLVCEPAIAAQLSFVSAVALYESIFKLKDNGIELDLAIKWPNDLLLNGKKVAGILIESSKSCSNGGLQVIVGCGVNCNTSPSSNELNYQATSFAEEGIDIQPDDLFNSYSIQLSKQLSQWNEGKGFADIRERWLKYAKGLNETIIARLSNEEIVGVFQDIDDDGALILISKHGKKHTITAADVFFHPISKG